jgi:SAM-dependent methyltransferase
MQSLLILGRQPALGLAELESLYGPDVLRPVGPFAVAIDLAPEAIDFGRLGGSIKLAQILETYSFTDWPTLEQHLEDDILSFIKHIPEEGKLRLGLSTYGLRASTPDINKTGLKLKKVIKITGRSVRVVPNKFPELNSAQILHNQLTGPTGCELVLFRDGTKTILARTAFEQDIEAYAARDQNRPMRDAKVGMLPPKLAQIIINLTNPDPDAVVLDPFCGTGVLLQEAALMGNTVYGTDLEPRMIAYSRDNLNWLRDKYHINFAWQLEEGNATSYTWGTPVGAIAGETFLGKPLTSLPPQAILDQIMRECDEIHDKFLRNIGKQITPGTRLCLAVPAWKSKTGFYHLKTLDYLADLGYTRKKFEFAKTSELIYFRPDQTVARELVVLEKS